MNTSEVGNRQLTIVFILICTAALGDACVGQMFQAVEEFIEEIRRFAKKQKLNISIDTLINAERVYWQTDKAVPLEEYEWSNPGVGGKFKSSKVFSALSSRLDNYARDEYLPILYLFGGILEPNLNSANYNALKSQNIYQLAIRNAVILKGITAFLEAFATSPEHVFSEVTPECLKKGLILKLMKELVLQSDQTAGKDLFKEAEQKIKKFETLYEDSKNQYLELYQKYQNENTQHRADLQTVINENAQHRADLQTVINENAQLRADLQTVINENTQHRADLQTVINENAQITNKYNYYYLQFIYKSNEVNNLNLQLDGTIIDFNSKCNEYNKLNSEYEIFKSKHVPHIAELQTIKSENAKLKNELQNKINELNKMKSDSVKQLSKNDIISFAITNINRKEPVKIDKVTRIAIEDMLYSFHRLLSESNGYLELNRFPELEKATQIALNNYKTKVEKILTELSNNYHRTAIVELKRNLTEEAINRIPSINLENNDDNSDLNKNYSKTCNSDLIKHIGILRRIILVILSAIIIFLIMFAIKGYYVELGEYYTRSTFIPVIISLVLGLGYICIWHAFHPGNYKVLMQGYDFEGSGCLEIIVNFVIFIIIIIIIAICHI
ncbi:MAG: hypothetical protein IJ165_03430 [Proteobacteria bacterium]|nr:hypothetical protein [Pseudomonadota bacterium]